MISAKKLIKMARKWHRLAALRRKRISYPRKVDEDANTNNCSSTSVVVDKGHFVVYSDDKRRFVIPLAYLNNDVFRELLKMSEEEFGLPTDGPITLPWDALFMDYVLTILRNGICRDVQKSLLMSLAAGRCLSSSSSSSSCSQHEWRNEQLLVF